MIIFRAVTYLSSDNINLLEMYFNLKCSSEHIKRVSAGVVTSFLERDEFYCGCCDEVIKNLDEKITINFSFTKKLISSLSL